MYKLQHLYNRLGFGLSPREWANYQNQDPATHVTKLFAEAKKRSSLPQPQTDTPDRSVFADPEAREEFIKERLMGVAVVNANWISRMANTNASPLLERMCLFWHGHFACDIKSDALAIGYLNTLRRHALGKFGDLVKAIAREPAMVRYLNNQQNKKQSPNENFARELMELFTIGRGAYQENDIKEAARAFTGWSSTLNGEFQFRSYWHDYGTKTFMGRTGKWDGDDIIDIILENPQTAKFIAQKIYRYFVHDQGNPIYEAELANVLYHSDYDISDTMKHLALSSWFYTEEVIQTRIKSPIDLLAGLMRQLGIRTDDVLPLIYIQRLLGQVLFRPPNVSGWPGGRHWIDNATLMNRLNLAQALILGSQLTGRAKDNPKAREREASPKQLKMNIDLEPLLTLGKAPNIEGAIANLTAYLLPGTKGPEPLVLRYSRGDSPQETIAFAAVRLMSMPEYQLC